MLRRLVHLFLAFVATPLVCCGGIAVAGEVESPAHACCGEPVAPEPADPNCPVEAVRDHRLAPDLDASAVEAPVLVAIPGRLPPPPRVLAGEPGQGRSANAPGHRARGDAPPDGAAAAAATRPVVRLI